MAKKISNTAIRSTSKLLKDMGYLDVDLRTLSDKKLNSKEFRRNYLRRLNKFSAFKDYTPIEITSKPILESVKSRLETIQSKSKKSKVYFNPNITIDKFNQTKKRKEKIVIGKVEVDADDGVIKRTREVKMLHSDGSISKEYETSVSLPLDFKDATSIYSFLDVYAQAEERGELNGKAFRASIFGDRTKSTFNSIKEMIKTMSGYKLDIHSEDKHLLENFIKDFELIEYSSYTEGYNSAKLEAQAKDMQSRKLAKVRKRNAK